MKDVEKLDWEMDDNSMTIVICFVEHTIAYDWEAIGIVLRLRDDINENHSNYIINKYTNKSLFCDSYLNYLIYI